MNPIYEELRKKLDHLSFGFPATEGGYEYPVLQSRFDETDAEYALALSSDKFDTPAELAERMGKEEAVVAKQLDKMVDKGLIYFNRNEEGRIYRFMPWIFGIIEFQTRIGNRDEEYLNIQDDMIGHGFGTGMWGNDTPLFRYVPVNSELVSGNEILPNDDAMHLIDVKDPDHIALLPCPCREQERTHGRQCKHEGFENSCLWFNEWADFWVERGDGKYITPEEAKDLLRKAEKEGLLIETVNNEITHSDCMCLCCTCCCGPMRMLKNFPDPARKNAGNYYIEKFDDKCTNCGTCIGRCPMDAMIKEGDRVIHDPIKCVGCGICVSTCEGKALELHRKPDELYNKADIPTIHDLHVQLQKEYRARVGE